MTTPSDIANLVRRTQQGGQVEEMPGHLVLRSVLDDAELRADWLALRDGPPEYLSAVTITDEDVDDAALEADEIPLAGQRYRIVIRSVRVDGQLRLFFARSLMANAERLPEVDHVLIADMGPQETFSTYRSRIQLWTRDAPEPFAPSERLPDPRTYSSDFTGGGEVPGDIRPWLLRAPPTEKGDAYEAWSRLAARRLLASLADRVSLEDSAIRYHFSGPPSCAVTLDDDQAAALLPRLLEGGAWVYPDSHDTDTRHLLLAAEWARTHRSGDPTHLGDGSLESAKAAYAAYVKAGSRETLKALAELRKAVIDETQKAAQRAQDLAGAMWKDLAVAAAPFVLKILPDAGKLPNRTLAGGMAIAAAAFLIFSFLVQVYINKRYFRHQKEARGVWKRALNIALRAAEVEEYSEVPIRKAVTDYRHVRLAVGTVYAFLVGILIWYASVNLSPVHPPRPPINTSAAAPTNGTVAPNSSNAQIRPAPNAPRTTMPGETAAAPPPKP
ncbi:MAG: hypothetical protein JHD15_01240 [Phenylobacterium sp.]|uniref:hypothetical protein n=1 Tax=Phenylobacterium sp. TaxID=1871053 RepID=UPI001A18DE76|nr:hypothetical protein [Phenylobacterium sp.]MBJ7408978.1 hypothetical protein [Phenylobacterium sp.]